MSAETLRLVVVDASVAVKWLVSEPDTPRALRLRHEWQAKGRLIAAPDFLLIELHNILWKKLRQGHVGPTPPWLDGGAPSFTLDVNWFSAEALLPQAWPLARRFDISIYDALYAALAQQLQASFYTADARLAERLGPSLTVHVLTPAR